MNLRIVWVWVLVLGLMAPAFASASPPVREKWQAYDQADGSRILLLRRGDASLHWYENRQGAVVIYSAERKRYEYAELRQQGGRWDLVANGVQASANLKIDDGESLAPRFITSNDLLPLRKQRLNDKPDSHHKKSPPPSR